MERELPMGTRTIEPRSVAEALIWFGASKCGSRRRYAFTLGFRIRQISSAWVRMRSMNSQPNAGQLLLALFVPEQIGLALGDGNVGVHAAAVDADDGLGQEAGGVAHVVGDLPAEQLVELNLVGRRHHFAVAVVDFELAGRDLGVVLLVLEAHCPLHFGRGVNELAQRIERQHVIVAAGVDELELARLVIFLFRIPAGEEEALNLVGRVQRVALSPCTACRQ